MDNSSARNLWGDFLDAHLEFAFVDAPKLLSLCNGELDMDHSANLVKRGIKKATSPSLLGMQNLKTPLPKIDDFWVVIDSNEMAQCIVRTKAVYFRPYFNINAQYAQLEGEGDLSLAYWQRTHWDYYTRELGAFERNPQESMIIVCHEFEKVFDRK